ncbi:hypothetical protein L1887_62753 [Cichorium endivia]|nr:hypothetical protein L1887_62753 [Cichorium endivia]
MREREMFEKVRKERIENKELMSHMAATTNAQRSVMQTQVSEGARKVPRSRAPARPGTHQELRARRTAHAAHAAPEIAQALCPRRRSIAPVPPSLARWHAASGSRGAPRLADRPARSGGHCDARAPAHSRAFGTQCHRIELQQSAPDADDTPATPRDNAPSPQPHAQGQAARAPFTVRRAAQPRRRDGRGALPHAWAGRTAHHPARRARRLLPTHPRPTLRRMTRMVTRTPRMIRAPPPARSRRASAPRQARAAPWALLAVCRADATLLLRASLTGSPRAPR